MTRLKYNLPEKVPDLIELGLRVAADGTANATTLTNPSPTPAAVNAATLALEQANTAAGTRAKGTVLARSPKETSLRNILHQWGAYLETIAANTPGQEAYIYALGGFSERETAKRTKKPLTLTQPGASGTAHASCKAAPHGKKAFYGWRISLNGGQTWIVSSTNDSKTDFAGIPVGTLIQVQFNVTMKNVASEWSSSETLLVH